MERKHQLKLTLNFSLTFTEGTPEYDGAYYVKNGLLPEKEAIHTAIAATYSMVGAAMRGADEQTVRDRIAFSDEAIHGYQMRALSRINGKCSVSVPIVNKTMEPNAAPDGNYANQNEVF